LPVADSSNQNPLTTSVPLARSSLGSRRATRRSPYRIGSV